MATTVHSPRLHRPPNPITANELAGTRASGGCATGPARILHTREDAASLRPGDIVVCATAATSWSALLPRVAGIVTDAGGALSSLATVARECGVPAVVGVRNATAFIHNGDTISLDGARGVVVVAARRHAAA